MEQLIGGAALLAQGIGEMERRIVRRVRITIPDLFAVERMAITHDSQLRL